MPFLPIDLQTMFAQMNHVGKEQAVQREVAPLLQALQGSEIVRKSEEQDTSVNQTTDVGEGLEKVKEEGSQGRKRRGQAEKKNSDTPQPRETFTDPDLGHYIDITG